jgi:hypothetical protein
MTVQSPAFLLRVANVLIEEVEQKTDSVLEAARTLERREGFMESLKGAIAAGALLGSWNETWNWPCSWPTGLPGWVRAQVTKN